MDASSITAIVSVSVSGLVAGGGLVLTAVNARGQRRHEVRQGFAERSWEQHSTTIFELIALAREMRDNGGVRRMLGDDGTMVRAPITDEEGNEFDEWRARLGDLMSQVEVYATTECLAAAENLLRSLRNARVMVHGVLGQQRASGWDTMEAEIVGAPPPDPTVRLDDEPTRIRLVDDARTTIEVARQSLRGEA